MNHARLVLGLFVVAAVITGTVGYDAVQGDRSVDVAVASEQDAYLGIDRVSEPVAITNGETAAVFSVTNRLGTDVDLTVRVDASSLTADTAADALAPSDTTDVTVTCGDTDSHSVDVEVSADGEDVSVTTVKTVSVDCQSASSGSS